MSKVMKRLESIFPDYFERFTLPEGAKAEFIKVYRACRTGKCDKESFLPSFEEKGFVYAEKDDPSDAGIYSLSTYEKPRDVKRFAATDSDLQVPYKIAQGYTCPKFGLVQKTKERDISFKKSSHVDWWLYKDAYPYEIFTIIPDFTKFLEEYKLKGACL